MGLKDRLRETAMQAQEGLAKGQAKLGQLQTRLAGGDEFRALGQGYWLHQSGRASAEQLAELTRAVAPALEELERQDGPIAWPSPPPPPMAPTAQTAPAPWATPAPGPLWGTPAGSEPSAPMPSTATPYGAGTAPGATSVPTPAPTPMPVPSSAPSLTFPVPESAPTDPAVPPAAPPGPPPAGSGGLPTAVHHDPGEPIGG